MLLPIKSVRNISHSFASIVIYFLFIRLHLVELTNEAKTKYHIVEKLQDCVRQRRIWILVARGVVIVVVIVCVRAWISCGRVHAV